MKCILLQLYCFGFHLAACIFSIGSSNLTIVLPTIVSVASMMHFLITSYLDRSARQFSLLVFCTCVGCFALVNFFRWSVFAAQLYIPPFLCVVQVFGLFVSLRSIDTQLLASTAAPVQKSYGTPHLFAATTTFAVSVFILRQSPLMNGLSFAWVSYSILVINLVLLMTRLTTYWMLENNAINSKSPSPD